MLPQYQPAIGGFNPRPRTRANQATLRNKGYVVMFQSTPPHEGER